MKTLIIYLIRTYQIIPFSTHNWCRFQPTCSEYMIRAIDKYGLKKGIKLGIKRIKKCHPKGGYGIDEVP
ncbi:MAG: membrane protein insertion efficiency factor YidD [Firmicutes bacterium]|nr:membrane protein insertion efficiency factor YidD [Bacillota bacterium]